MKVGIELKIDVTKIDKQRLYRGEKGTYLTMTAFVDLDEKDQYGNNGMITHKKNEGEDKAPILGNSKVFWSDSPQQSHQQPQQGYQQPQQMQQYANTQAQASVPTQGTGGFDMDEKIPF